MKIAYLNREDVIKKEQDHSYNVPFYEDRELTKKASVLYMDGLIGENNHFKYKTISPKK